LTPANPGKERKKERDRERKRRRVGYVLEAVLSIFLDIIRHRQRCNCFSSLLLLKDSFAFPFFYRSVILVAENNDGYLSVRRFSFALSSSVRNFSIPVVRQKYEVQVRDAYVLAGNTAVLKCEIPAFVKEYVAVTSWFQDSAFNIYPTAESGEWHYIV